MNEECSKSGRISDWKIRIISGVSFTLSMMLMHLSFHLSDPETYGLFEPYITTIYILSAAIVGGYFGPKICRAIYNEKYLLKLLEVAFFILICEVIAIAFFLTILFLFLRVDIATALFTLVGMPFVFLVLYGKWKIAQIIITVGILFLVFRYIRDKESRE